MVWRGNPLKKIIAIVGPTASGKSALGERIAAEANGEIVSCDSVQVYKGFDIGTSKPSLEEQKRTPYHLIDVVSPTEEFHAGRYQSLADEAIRSIGERGKAPLVVGGTGLYLRALLHGLSTVPPISSSVLDRLNQELESGGLAPLYDELLRVDPAWAHQYPSTDTQRIFRGLSVFRETGKALSEFNKEHQFADERYHCRILAIHYERPELYERINARVLVMMEMGLLAEVEALMAAGVPRESRPMQAPGYVQLAEVIEGNMNLDAAIALIQQAHRRYAKRQMTWLRKTPNVEWIDPNDDQLSPSLNAWYRSP